MNGKDCILSSMLSSGYSSYWTWSVRLLVADVGPDSGRTVVCISAWMKAGTSTWYASLSHIVAQWSRRRLSRRSLSCSNARAHAHALRIQRAHHAHHIPQTFVLPLFRKQSISWETVTCDEIGFFLSENRINTTNDCRSFETTTHW